MSTAPAATARDRRRRGPRAGVFAAIAAIFVLFLAASSAPVPALRRLPAAMGLLRDHADRRVRRLRGRPARLAARASARCPTTSAAARCWPPRSRSRAVALVLFLVAGDVVAAGGRPAAAGHRHGRGHHDARRHARRPQPAARPRPGGRRQRRGPDRRARARRARLRRPRRSSRPRPPGSSTPCCSAGWCWRRWSSSRMPETSAAPAGRARVAAPPGRRPARLRADAVRAGADHGGQLGAGRALPLARPVGRRRPVRAAQPPRRRAWS